MGRRSAARLNKEWDLRHRYKTSVDPTGSEKVALQRVSDSEQESQDYVPLQTARAEDMSLRKVISS